MSSVSWGSLNHEETGTALFGWKMYDAGELSMMMVSDIGRPSCDRSCAIETCERRREFLQIHTDLDVIAPMIVASLSE